MTAIKNEALTHGGRFHADDVFSAALLKLLNPDIKIHRVFETPDDYDGIVFDIGYGKFDHHQENAEIRENGMPYASFGLLWREFGEGIMANLCPAEQAAKEAAHFDESFIEQLDEDDNTGCGNQLAGVIGSFNPSWDDENPQDKCFYEAVNFAGLILRKRLNGIASIYRAKKLVEEALRNEQDNIVILPRFAPWRMVLVPSDAEFVVYPSQRGGYSAQVIPTDFDTKEAKCDFPAEWAGKPGEELKKISGIETLHFCHKGRFLISADSLDDVIKACKKAREMSADSDSN